jgi:ABC-2 type transport system ATP-binding protein
LHRPRVLFLDEPSIGVDPVAARDLRSTVAGLAAAGTTLLLTTHYMAEADELCDRIAIIAQGELRAIGTPEELKRSADGRRIMEVEAFGLAPETIACVRRIPGVREAIVEARGATDVLTVQSASDVDVQRSVLAVLDGVRMGRITTRQPTLEDAYVAIVSASAGDYGDR